MERGSVVRRAAIPLSGRVRPGRGRVPGTGYRCDVHGRHHRKRSIAFMKLAVIPGDGIGPEVIAEALKVLDVVAPGVEKTEYDLGAKRYHRTGEILPESVLPELKQHDAILLGAIGDPSVPSGVLERGLLLHTRFALDHHVNLRPSKLFPGVTSPL